jgi:hypothetical protein
LDGQLLFLFANLGLRVVDFGVLAPENWKMDETGDFIGSGNGLLDAIVGAETGDFNESISIAFCDDDDGFDRQKVSSIVRETFFLG